MRRLILMEGVQSRDGQVVRPDATVLPTERVPIFATTSRFPIGYLTQFQRIKGGVYAESSLDLFTGERFNPYLKIVRSHENEIERCEILEVFVIRNQHMIWDSNVKEI